MQCLRIWFTIWLFAISVNNSVASPVDILNVDNKNVSDLNIAASNPDEAVISERDNEVGYLRKEDEKGADAYQHFESFHDKDGDAYGYEKHEAFGKSNKGESLNDEKDKDEGSHYNYVQELGDKPKYQKYHGSIDDPGKSKNSNYHYSYSDDDDDDDEAKPKHSSSYKAEAKRDDSSDGDDETDNNETDEEKTTNFSYKIISDDYAEDDAEGDISSKGSGNGNGYHFGHGDKNTDVNYNTKKSDYTASDDDEDDEDDDDDDDDEEDDEGSEEKDEANVIDKNQKIKDDQEKDKDTKSYSTYTTYNSQDGDDDEEDEDDTESDNKVVPKHAVRYEKVYPINDARQSNKQKFEENENSEENNKSDDDGGHIKEDVELHQPAKPRPTKPVVLVKEHRASYNVENDHPTKSTPTKEPQVIIQPSKPYVLVQEHRSGYKVEESSDGKGADDSSKGHAGSVTKHLYEIYVTHDTGKSNGGGGGGGGDDGSKGAGDAGGDGKGKSENLVLEQPQKLNKPADGTDNGAYKVNVNYGKNKGLKKGGKRINKKHKGILKKKKIIKPHKYEVEEYVDHEEETKQPIVAGKEASPQHHHRDSDDYSNGQQQFVYASEADSDAYYW